MSKNIYKIGDVFADDELYSDRAQFCNENGLMIVEITKQDDKTRLFQIQECPPPSEEDIIWNEIYQLKEELQKYKEDIEQVELFGMERTDYEEKKKACSNIVVRLRELERRLKENGKFTSKRDT